MLLASSLSQQRRGDENIGCSGMPSFHSAAASVGNSTQVVHRRVTRGRQKQFEDLFNLGAMPFRELSKRYFWGMPLLRFVTALPLSANLISPRELIFKLA